jgi:D-alanyl-lipoteichoic acid acyltransferase DltB (MBOAT superfamily)
VVDTYQGLRPPTRSFPDFALYVAFFPQLVAGPIARWGFFGPQLEAPRRVRFEGVEQALFLLAVGLVKKVVCADSLGAFVDRVYADVGHAGWVEIWVAIYAYAFQIYFDFSGYTDMAMGLAALLGFRLPENFRHPYLAESPSEFWRRWHISLSTWLRDYLYISLGGNRRGTLRTYVNLLVTMLLGGLWHGAAWTFVLWGGFHGVWLALHRACAGERAGPPRTPLWLRRVVTFHLVCLGWVLFRAGSLATAGAIFAGLFSGRMLWEALPLGTLALIAVGAVTHVLALRQDMEGTWFRFPRVVQGAVYGVVIVLVGLFSAHSGRFIYFQF